MKINKNIISDLIPLYAANECSADTRTLVEEYLSAHPQEAAELRRTMNTSLPTSTPPAKNLDEMEALRTARRRLRSRFWLFATAVFFSLAPFSLVFHKNGHYWLFRESPGSAIIYGAIGVGLWIAYFIARNRSRCF